MVYERVLLVKNEVFVYRTPPRQSNRGYRAAEWGLESPFWTGRLRAIEKGGTLNLRLEDKMSGELFANCPVEEYPGIAIETVLDSSRYFVIRLVADDGQTMFVGLGFAERSDAFDMNVAIQDHFKCLRQEVEAQEAAQSLSSEPSLNLGFKEGEKIKLNLNTKRSGDESSAAGLARPRTGAKQGQSGSREGGRLLPPPPAPAVSRSRGARTGPNNSTDQSQQLQSVATTDAMTRGSAISPNSPISSNAASNVDLLLGLFGGSGNSG